MNAASRMRRELEDKALERLRIELELQASKKETLSSSVPALTKDEDQEMSTIFEIVRLAQERFTSEERGQHVQDTHHTTYMDEGNMFPTLADATCAVPEDCARTCESECAHIAVKQHCDRECSAKCEHSCKVREKGVEQEKCAQICSTNCNRRCTLAKEKELEGQRDACIEEAPARCRNECETLTETLQAGEGTGTGMCYMIDISGSNHLKGNCQRAFSQHSVIILSTFSQHPFNIQCYLVGMIQAGQGASSHA
jgi:hypothetical protein